MLSAKKPVPAVAVVVVVVVMVVIVVVVLALLCNIITEIGGYVLEWWTHKAKLMCLNDIKCANVTTKFLCNAFFLHLFMFSLTF
jgi:hypothetical protein